MQQIQQIPKVSKQLRTISTQKDLKSSELNRQIKLLAKQKCEPKQIVDAFNKMKENGSFYDTQTYVVAQKSLIHVHCQNKEIRKAKKTWKDLIHNPQYKESIDRRDYFRVMSTFINHNYTNTALEIFYEMSDTTTCDYGIYMLAMEAAADLKSSEQATNIHQILINNHPELVESNKKIQNSLIDMYLKCDNVTNAYKIFESMENKHNIDTWNILLNGMISHDKNDEAFALFDEMIKRNIKPDSFTYSSIAKATGDSIDKANKVYELIKNDESIDLFRNVVLCNSLIVMFGKCEQFDIVMEIWNTLCENKNCDIDIRTWNSVINACLYSGKYGLVLDMYDELMKDEKLQPQIKTHHICIKACVESGNMEKVKHVLKCIKENRLKDWQQVMKMYKNYHGWDECIELWKNTSDELNGEEFSCMIHLCIDDGNNMKAFELFDEMQNVYSVKPTIKIYKNILRACENHLELIKEMHKQIIASGAEFYNNFDLVDQLMNLYKQCGEKELAKEVWRVFQRSRSMFD